MENFRRETANLLQRVVDFIRPLEFDDEKELMPVQVQHDEQRFRYQDIYTALGRNPDFPELKQTIKCMLDAYLLTYDGPISNTNGVFLSCVDDTVTKMANDGLAKPNLIYNRDYNAENVCKGSFRLRILKFYLHCKKYPEDQPLWWGRFVTASMTVNVTTVRVRNGN